MKRLEMFFAVAFLFSVAGWLAMGCPGTAPGTPKESSPGENEASAEAGTAGEDDEHADCDHEEGAAHEEDAGTEDECCGTDHGDNVWLIDIGNHAFLGNVHLCRTSGRVTLTILDHHDKKPFPVAVHEPVLNLVTDEGSGQLNLEAQPQEGDPEGKSSVFLVKDDLLVGLKTLKGRFNVKIEGKTYLCEIKQAH